VVDSGEVVSVKVEEFALEEAALLIGLSNNPLNPGILAN
jgi:hypothetical protein